MKPLHLAEDLVQAVDSAGNLCGIKLSWEFEPVRDNSILHCKEGSATTLVCLFFSTSILL